MKRDFLFLTVVVAFFCLLQIFCGVQQAVAADESNSVSLESEPVNDLLKAKTATGGPAITFKEVVHDFGDIGPGSENVCEFEFANTGDKLLRITKVSKTCGCTPYTLAKKNYRPGESGTLKVKYNASSHPGRTKKTLKVYSDDKKNSEVELVIKANIVEKISYLPKNIDFVLNKENAGCPEITISSLDGEPFSIKGFEVRWNSKSAEGGITADYDPSVESTTFVLKPKVNIEELEKGTRGYIEIALTHPEGEAVTIPFSLLPRFKTTPQSLIVYKAEAEKSVTKEVWVLSNYDEDFEVESTSTEKGAIKVLSSEKIDHRYKFELEVTPPAVQEGQKKFFTDQFFINIKGGEKLKITCRLFYS